MVEPIIWRPRSRSRSRNHWMILLQCTACQDCRLQLLAEETPFAESHSLWRPDLIGWRALSSRFLKKALCTCCVNPYVCLYKVSILGVFEYFSSLYHFVSLFLSQSLFRFWFLNKKFLTLCLGNLTLPGTPMKPPLIERTERKEPCRKGPRSLRQGRRDGFYRTTWVCPMRLTGTVIVCGSKRQLWPDIRAGTMAYLLQGASTTENKLPRIERA